MRIVFINIQSYMNIVITVSTILIYKRLLFMVISLQAHSSYRSNRNVPHVHGHNYKYNSHEKITEVCLQTMIMVIIVNTTVL